MTFFMLLKICALRAMNRSHWVGGEGEMLLVYEGVSCRVQWLLGDRKALFSCLYIRDRRKTG